ncbi:thiamine-phosphate kinase [Paucihalobacter ruber]|uniref:Thiamine-monophosphate kinase n=1 Tax=Paucihalobacter ruber TaxID=2567861 RepID=A0A506PLQ9_9FLAO|nr:thiamine-phosphate kinase [Paucihalobacter ruber]TPV34806.1 thiamine-phosphate kinase [Paucihalobacter ruber]
MIEDKSSQRTPLSQLGEFALIDHLTKDFTLNQNSSVLGVGDDAAVIKCIDENLVVSTDMLVEGVHFNLAYTPLKHLGYKAVVVNLSDIAAMNATPTQITVSVAVSNRFPVEALEELYAGIQTACNYYKVDLVGGDTTSSTSGLIISVTVIGFSNSENLVYRSGAKPNDLLVVTGDIGGAYMGLQVLERENEVFKVNPNNQPDLSMYTYIVERQLKPEARTDIVELLKKLEVKPTAMIDISDGLSSEIIHLCKRSKTGVDLFENKIPLDPQVISTCEEFNLDSTTIALSGGEDYELLMTIDQKDYDKIKGNPNLTVIGYMTEPSKGMHLVTRGDTKVELIAKGWQSF